MQDEFPCLGFWNFIWSSLQVLVWKTNFDKIDYNEVLQSHKARSQVQPAPHIHDIHPRSPMYRQAVRPLGSEVNTHTEPRDMTNKTPTVTNLGPALFSQHRVSTFNKYIIFIVIFLIIAVLEVVTSLWQWSSHLPDYMLCFSYSIFAEASLSVFPCIIK